VGIQEIITEQERRRGLLPEYAFYTGAGAGPEVDAEVCPKDNQNFEREFI